MTPTKPPPSLAEEERDDDDAGGRLSSAAEQCGFAAHVAIVLVSGWYFLGALVRWWCWRCPAAGARYPEEEHFCHSSAFFFYRPPSALWTRYLPTATLGLFVAIPLLYAFLNGRSAARPDEIEAVQDEVGPSSKDTTRDVPAASVAEKNLWNWDSNCVPAICDIDPALINDLVWRNLSSSDFVK